MFQRYSVDGSVLPLSDSQLYQLTQQAKNAISVVKKQRKDDLSLIQGHWQGNRLIRCGSKKPLEMTFNPALSEFTARQLSQQGQNRFIVVSGKIRREKVEASQLLMLTDDNGQCIAPPLLCLKSNTKLNIALFFFGKRNKKTRCGQRVFLFVSNVGVRLDSHALSHGSRCHYDGTYHSSLPAW